MNEVKNRSAKVYIFPKIFPQLTDITMHVSINLCEDYMYVSELTDHCVQASTQNQDKLNKRHFYGSLYTVYTQKENDSSQKILI